MIGLICIIIYIISIYGSVQFIKQHEKEFGYEIEGKIFLVIFSPIIMIILIFLGIIRAFKK